MQLALLCLWSKPIGFWKLDNLLCSWLEQELRRQDWLLPGLLSTVAARVYFLVIAVKWSLFVISFSAWDPLLFFRIVVCCKRSLRIQSETGLPRAECSWPGPRCCEAALPAPLAGSGFASCICGKAGRQAGTCECSHDGPSCLPDKRALVWATKRWSAFPVAKGDL